MSLLKSWRDFGGQDPEDSFTGNHSPLKCFFFPLEAVKNILHSETEHDQRQFFFLISLTVLVSSSSQACIQTPTGPPPPVLHPLHLLKLLEGQLGQVMQPLANEKPGIPECL